MIETIINRDGTTFQREIEAPTGVDKEIYVNEMLELKTWFDTYYTRHEQKYRRLMTFEELTDEGTDPREELLKLYKTAEINRKRIQELENLLQQ